VSTFCIMFSTGIMFSSPFTNEITSVILLHCMHHSALVSISGLRVERTNKSGLDKVCEREGPM
jgi:hypothetical protein